MKEAAIQDIKETVAEAFKQGFQADSRRTKSAFFRFLEIALIDKIHPEPWAPY